MKLLSIIRRTTKRKKKVNNMSNESMKNVCYDHFGKRAHYSISGGPSMASLSRERTKREENEGHCSTLGSSFIVRVVVAIYSWWSSSGEMVLQVQFLIFVSSTIDVAVVAAVVTSHSTFIIILNYLAPGPGCSMASSGRLVFYDDSSSGF